MNFKLKCFRFKKKIILIFNWDFEIEVFWFRFAHFIGRFFPSVLTVHKPPTTTADGGRICMVD